MESNSSKRSRWDSDDEEDDKQELKKRKEKEQKKKKDKLVSTSSSFAKESNTKEGSDINQTLIIEKNSEQEQLQNVSAAVVPCRPGRKPFSDRSCRSVESYERLNFIDQGTYGVVFRARCNQTGKIYAVKQVKPGNLVGKVGFPPTALREINILLELSHPNIVSAVEMVVGSSMDKIYMVMEFCENDLKTVMKLNQQSFSTSEIKRLMVQLLSAMEYMHSKHYLHRDLKTSNLLYSNKGRLCVCDLGLARKYDDPPKPYTPEVVTLWYRCPELLLGSKLYSAPLDMWSVGCIMGELITGEAMFPGEGELATINAIFRTIGAPSEERWPGFQTLPHSKLLSWKLPSRSKLRELFPKTAFSGGIALSDLGVNLLEKLLDMNPLTRLSASQGLLHPWLVDEAPYPTPEELMPSFRSRHDPV